QPVQEFGAVAGKGASLGFLLSERGKRNSGQCPIGKLRRPLECFLVGVIVHPRGREAVEIATNPPLHRRTLESVRERRLALIPLVGLVALAADILLADPLATDAHRQLADNAAVGLKGIAVLPVAGPDNGVEAVHHIASVDEADGQGTVALDALRFPANDISRKGCRQGGEIHGVTHGWLSPALALA